MNPKQFIENIGHDDVLVPGTRVQIPVEKIYDLMQQYAEMHLLNQRAMPLSLTAENGAKALLIGEFYEVFEHGESDDLIERPVPWTTIKKIYNRIVGHYTSGPTDPNLDSITLRRKK